MKDYRRYSLWLDTVSEELAARPPLQGDLEVDVAIVGAGYTGLWTAYYLLKAAPDTKVAIVEKEIAGFGASGRNGGWCSALFAAGRKKISARYGRAAALAMQQEMFRTVDEVGRVCDQDGIDCDFHKGGTLTLVTSPPQLARVRKGLEEEREWGLAESDYRWLQPHEVSERLRLPHCEGAVFTPHCARIHPAKLVRGLANTVEALGGSIYEQTEATAIRRGVVVAESGTVAAPVVVRATEGYTPDLPGLRRRLLPLYSLMIATEPLSQDAWDEIGWDGCETIHDGRHLLIYAQRTADGRIAIGGRGAPYHFGSRVADDYDRVARIHRALKETLAQLFPAAGAARVTHAWGGPLGVPRDWFSSVGFDSRTGLGWAGGYVGDGVATANLAGRTLTDLILERETSLTRLPWVGHASRAWEPEPLRWLGVNTALKLMASADKKEMRTGRPTKRGDLVKRLIGI
ncbi:MAG TPA: FAD-binding oxidoreductase [Actinomycetota bacterium]|nr:FAD-binding oxidoreductase [Actinomycetota bacterium]